MRDVSFQTQNCIGEQCGACPCRPATLHPRTFRVCGCGAFTRRIWDVSFVRLGESIKVWSRPASITTNNCLAPSIPNQCKHLQLLFKCTDSSAAFENQRNQQKRCHVLLLLNLNKQTFARIFMLDSSTCDMSLLVQFCNVFYKYPFSRLSRL